LTYWAPSGATRPREGNHG